MLISRGAAFSVNATKVAYGLQITPQSRWVKMLRQPSRAEMVCSRASFASARTALSTFVLSKVFISFLRAEVRERDEGCGGGVEQVEEEGGGRGVQERCVCLVVMM